MVANTHALQAIILSFAKSDLACSSQQCASMPMLVVGRVHMPLMDTPSNLWLTGTEVSKA